MRRFPVFLIFLLNGLIHCLPLAAEQLPLSLNEAVRIAVENNLEVRAERYTPAQFEADINRYGALYDPKLVLETRIDDTEEDRPTIEERVIDTRSQTTEVSLGRLFPSGAEASIGFNNSDTDTDNPSYLEHYGQTDLVFSISQPLFKNRGREVTEENIRVSQISKYASLERFKTKLLATIAQVRNDYYKLFRLKEELGVKQVSLELAKTILAETRARVASGVLPSLEILNAEFGVVQREKDLIDAEKAVADQLDALRLLLQLEAGVEILPTDKPSHEVPDIPEEAAVSLALKRPDLLEQKKNLELAEFQTRIYQNKLEPDISLKTSLGVDALDRDRDYDPVGIGKLDNFGWSVGLVFSYPLGNRAAENEYVKSRLKSEQIRLRIRSLEENISNEVRAALREIHSGFKQIEVADRGAEFAEQRLHSFIRKHEAGLATTKEVLDVETDLADARNNQIASLVSYADALTRLWLVTGELTKRQGISVDETEADQLYKDMK
ncbi:MAG: TolC family protein [Desulfobacteraceae bacterium]|nr:TolC family protein [Desulfobacteraceae bacterium]